MTEEIKYNKDEKWIPYEQLAETPQQTIARLEQERDELKQENEKLLDARNHFMAENLKYFNALEEIKVIADDTFKVCDDDCGNARKIKLIIDKINEVLQ